MFTLLSVVSILRNLNEIYYMHLFLTLLSIQSPNPQKIILKYFPKYILYNQF